MSCAERSTRGGRALDALELELDADCYPRDGSIEFERSELRRTRGRRELLCGCVIPPRDEYRYYVAKLYGVAGLVQTTACDPCSRYGLAGEAASW